GAGERGERRGRDLGLGRGPPPHHAGFLNAGAGAHLHRRVRRALGSLTLTQGIANTGSNQACTYGLHDLGRISGVNCVNGPTTLWNQGFTIDWRGTPRGFAPRPALRSAERARCDARTPGPSPAGPAPLRSPGAQTHAFAPSEFRGHSAPTWPAVPTARPPRTASGLRATGRGWRRGGGRTRAQAGGRGRRRRP